MLALLLPFLANLVPGIGKVLVQAHKDTLDAKNTAERIDADVTMRQLDAVQAANVQKANIIALPWVRWLMFAMYTPCIAHLSGIVLGRMQVIQHDMLPLDSIEQTILLSLVVYVPASKFASNFVSK